MRGGSHGQQARWRRRSHALCRRLSHAPTRRPARSLRSTPPSRCRSGPGCRPGVCSSTFERVRDAPRCRRADAHALAARTRTLIHTPAGAGSRPERRRAGGSEQRAGTQRHTTRIGARMAVPRACVRERRRHSSSAPDHGRAHGPMIAQRSELRGCLIWRRAKRQASQIWPPASQQASQAWPAQSADAPPLSRLCRAAPPPGSACGRV